MTTYIPTFEPGVVDTPAGMTTAVALGGFSGIPGSGTGLAGAVYAPGDPIRSLADLAAIIGAQDPDLTFTSTEVFYMARHSETSVAEFLRDDANSLSGDGTGIEMGPAGITLSGFIYIPPGTHAITVYADDGFALSLGGVEFAAADGVTHGESVTRVAEFDGGLYAVELAYYDAYSAMALGLAIDGLPVDQSAFYQSVEDFTDPPADVPLVPVAEYHPSYFLGEETLETPVDGNGTEGRDVIDGKGADDTLIGGGGDDELRGGYDNDQLLGGDGNDVLEGGRGSDLLDGGAGDDLLISRSDAGEQRIGQLAIGAPTRPDPDGEVDPDRQKLTAYLGQPLIGDDLLIGGEGRDTFLIAPQINAKADIIAQHIKDDGSIDWSGGGIAGENDEVHDHWVDSFGIDVVADYNAEEDTIAIIGHTATIHITYADVWGDEAEESIITVISNQGGGGGAHTQDLIGQLIVHGDRVELGDVQTDAGVTYGIVDDITGLPEALFPKGELKMTEIEGQTVYGYDTRDDQGNLGPVTANPAAYFDNPFFTEDMLVTPVHGDEAELTRGPFDQLGTIAVAGEDNTAPGAAKAATANDDMIAPDAAPAPEGLQGALAYWTLAGGADGVFDDARGGQELRAYTLYENQALLRTDGATAGRDGTEGTALYFDGEDDFAFINHDQTFEVSQGTIALWVRPDNLVGGKDIFLSKDNSGTVDGGHFRLGHAEDGRLYLRTAPGDGDSNKAWISNDVVFTEGEWAQVAVSYTAEGVTVYVNGVAIGADGWTAVEGDVPSPNEFTGYFMLNNEEPWVLGADTHRTERNDTAQEFGIDHEDLASAFEGAIQDVGIWGGMNAEDALNAAEIAELMANGPGAALTNLSGPAPMLAGDDVFAGGAGNDTLDGGRGSDKLEGGAGDDLLISRADSGEQRAGQLVLGEPSRPFPDPSISNEYLKLIDWVDQPIVGDDLMIGGEGADHFYFETVINAKMDIIMEHIQDDGRTINWAGVAGENNRIHDHWVDTLGIDIIADFDASEDSISVIGHTTQIEVSYKAIDTNGDGLNDDIVSIIHAYSQQGGGGGAHDEDSLGYIVVYGDLVEEGMVQTNAAVMYGIVETIDDLNEALAPTGETKTSIGPNGEALFGYDSRDVDGDPIGADPASYSSNSWFQNGDVELASAIPEGVDPPAIVMTDVGGTFDGSGADTKKIDHTTPMAQAEGTWAFSFTADDPNGATWQALLSKDHSDYKDGGHLTVYLSPAGQLKVRFQSETETRYLYGETVEAGVETQIAFTFENGVLKLYQNGELVADADGFPAGMLGNSEDIVLGASTETRVGANDNLRYFFTGTIGNLAVLDRPLTEYEAFFLSDAGGDLDALAALYDGDLPLVENPGDPGPNLLEGDEGNNSLHGYDDADLILGHGGDDHLYGYGDDDEMDGGAGNDRAFGGDGNDTMRGAAGDDSLYGDAGDDDLDGGEGNDHLRGGDGNDQITGGLGNDRSFGENGNDVINGGEGDDSAYGGAGEDTILGGAGNDWMKGGDDNDTLSGGAGNDYARGGAGADTVDGGEGDDRMLGYAGEDVVTGGLGNDSLYGGDDNDQLDGGDGDDRLSGGGGDDTLKGAAGNDRMYGGDGDDDMEGGDGDDRLSGGDGNDRLVGGAGLNSLYGGLGADTLIGGAMADILRGGEGNDIITGDGGDDLTGGLGNDYVSGGDGEDTVTGGLGDDRLRGGGDNDVLIGDDGNDDLRGGEGDDDLDAGEGDDRLYGDGGDDEMDGGDGADYMHGGDGNDMMSGGDGDDNMYGDAGNDTLVGGDGNDNLRAGSGDDDLNAGAGNDRLFANEGTNTMEGGIGNDLQYAGLGADTFVFREFGAANEDRIRYFDAGVDKIALDAAAFDVGPAFDAALFEFASAASTADTRFTYDQATGDLFFDADGNGAGAAERIAELDNGTALTIDDFVFV